MENNYDGPKKLNYQLQQMAFQKYPFQINGKPFFCFQSYFENQLLNGVDLQLQQAKGMSCQPQKVAYMSPSQQLILAIGSNLIAYNTQKRFYSLLAQVYGYVQMIRTYNCKINNKSYVYWLQSDQQGLNKKSKQQSSRHLNNLSIKKVPSIIQLNKTQDQQQQIQISQNKIQNKINKENSQQENKNNKQKDIGLQQKQQTKSIKKLKNAITNKIGTLNKIKKDGIKKQNKNVNFKIQNLFNFELNQQNDFEQTIKKKRMRIGIFDYQKKKLVHKQMIEIKQNQTIAQLVLYCTPQKILGYIINDSKLHKSRIYYRKLNLKQSQFSQKYTVSKKYLNSKQKNNAHNLKLQNFHILQSRDQIKNLKYNGQTDLYLFNNNNEMYSLQISQGQFQITSRRQLNKQVEQKNKNKQNKSSNSINIQNQNQNKDKEKEKDKDKDKDKQKEKEKEKQKEKEKEKDKDKDKEKDKNKVQDQLTQNIIKATQNIINFKQTLQNISHQSINNLKDIDKYRLMICSQISVGNKQTLLDFSISQVYLVLLSNKSIFFYSVFNLNTLLFKFQLPNFQQYPKPIKIQLNKSYLILNHQKSNYISLFTILQRNLKYNTTCEVEIQHSQEIMKLFMNNYNCEVAILAKQFQIQGRMTNIIKSKKIIVNSNAAFKKTFIDVNLAYINFSSTRCQSKPLFLKQQKFKNILTCKWHCQYLIETQNQILAKQWRESFQNLKCACFHPTGQYLIIVFNDCFKIYAVTFEGLQNTYMSDGVKQCQSITYSQHGQHFAVGSANTIGIYNSYNCRKLHTIVCSVGSLIQHLQYYGNFLICTLKNKRVSVHNVLFEYKQTFSFNPKTYISQNKSQLQRKPNQLNNLLLSTISNVMSIQINSLFLDINLDVIIFSSGRKLFFVNTITNQSLGNYDLQGITCMEYSKYLSTLFLGTVNGQVIAFPWPNKPSNILDQLPKFKFHCQKIVKIKLTPDFKYLISIGSDMSMYKSNISYILNLKRLKGVEISQYKGNRATSHYSNFLYNKGFCQFSHPQNIQKIQIRKQYQQQVVNTVFILPQQRVKQRQNLFNKLNSKQKQIVTQNRQTQQPLQLQSITLRNNIIKLKQCLHKIKKQNQQQIYTLKLQFKQSTSNLLKKYSQLNSELQNTKLKYEQKLNQQRERNHKIYLNKINQNQKEYKQLQKKLKQTQNQSIKAKNSFLQFDLICQQKQKYLKSHLQEYIKQFQYLKTKNGQLSCNNSTIQKQISMLKYRIQQLKFVCLNSKASIEKLTHKKEKQQSQKIIFQRLLMENAKIDVSQMEKKYIKETKQLIQKNKQIDIKLLQYQKQRQMLVKLQKTVQKTQQQIDAVVQDLTKEKQFMRQIKKKIENNNNKLIQCNNIKLKKKSLKNKTKLQLKKFIQQLEKIKHLFQQQQSKNKIKNGDNTFYLINSLIQFEQKINKENKQEQQNVNNTYQNKKANMNENINNINRTGSNNFFTIYFNDSTNTNNHELKKKKSSRISSINSSLLIRKDSISNRNPSSLVRKNSIFSSRNTSLLARKDSKYLNNKNMTQIYQQKNNQNENIKINTIRNKSNISHYNKRFNSNTSQKKQRLSDFNKTVTNFNSTQRKDYQSTIKNQKQPNTKRYLNILTQRSQPENNLNNFINNRNNNNQNNLNQNLQFKRQPIKLINYQKDQKIMQRHKQDINKKISAQEKIMNNIKTDRGLFISIKKKLNIQNQDLIATYNSLAFDNKNLYNIKQLYQRSLDIEDKYYYKNKNKQNIVHQILNLNEKNTQNNIQSSIKPNHTINNFQLNKKTPFQKYLTCRQKKVNEITKQNNYNSYMLTSYKDQTEQNQKIIKKAVFLKQGTQKRIKTLPSVQYKI